MKNERMLNNLNKISKSLIDDINRILEKGTIREKIRIKDNTPEILYKYGAKNLPMTMTSTHLLENILTEKKAKEKGFKVNKKTHYHGLGKEKFIDAIIQLDNPSAIYRWKSNNESNNYGSNDFIVLTELITNETRREGGIIVLLFLEEIKGTYNIKSIYGKKEIFKYLNNYTKKGDLEKLYIKKEDSNKSGRVQSPTSLKTSSN